MTPVTPVLTIVAFYGPKPEPLRTLIHAVQQEFGAALGDTFRPRPIDDVHATVLGLEDAPDRADDVAAFLAAELTATPLEVQFGGFPADEAALLSRGSSLRDRSVVIDGAKAVVLGWPVSGGRPSARLGELRRACARFGVTHKYHRGTMALDPDAYLVVGDVRGDGPHPGIAEQVRAAVLDRPTAVPLSASDVSLVQYADPALPRGSSAWRALDER